MELIQSNNMHNDERKYMENIKVGDILLDRDTRRVGRKVKVVFVEQDAVTVEVIADSINSKKSSVGTNTDIARNRLKKGYTLQPADVVTAGSISTTVITSDMIESNLVPEPIKISIVSPKGISEEEIGKAAAKEVARRVSSSMSVHPTSPAGSWREDNGFTKPEDNDVVSDPSSLENALNSAGYFWLPPVEDLVEAVKIEAPVLTKTGLVHLIHSVIRESLVTGQ